MGSNVLTLGIEPKARPQPAPEPKLGDRYLPDLADYGRVGRVRVVTCPVLNETTSLYDTALHVVSNDGERLELATISFGPKADPDSRARQLSSFANLILRSMELAQERPDLLTDAPQAVKTSEAVILPFTGPDPA